MIFFWIKESFRLIARAKSSFFLSLISMSIALALISASVFSINFSNYLQNKLKRSVNINVFLNDTITKKDINNLKKKISNEKFVYSVRYIDKKKAAELFIKDTGEDFRKLIDYNPLPASFAVSLKGEYVTRTSIKNVVKKLSSFVGVNEVSLKYDYIYKLISYLDRMKNYIFIFALVIFFISLYIVYSTILLVINSKYTELNTMKLVGAKLSTIKIPIILNGFFIGVFSTVILFVIGYMFVYFLSNYLPIRELLGFESKISLIFLAVLGPVIGLAVSIISLRKITLKF
ncbi:MAG TPA: FtsX-like permease family protein [Ignavibacteria bacterium]|nr:FtsX-like permease family protein [Ignavibacteria bacterium]